MNYTQYRLAKRNGEIIMQKRSMEVITKRAWKWWQLWKLGEFEMERVHGEWVDEPFVDLHIWKKGDRVRANSNSGFHKGAVGTIEFVEPSGRKVWVLRDGARCAVYFHPEELEPENG